MAVYMGSQRLSELAPELAAAGWAADTPVVVSERVGYRDETHHHTTLGGMASLSVEQPAVLLVGIHAFPPEGVTLFVGTDPAHFLKHGPLLHWPLIRLVARPIEERVSALKEVLGSVTGVILPGRFAVRTLIETLMAIGDARLLQGKKLLAVGPATADELAGFGLWADLAAASLGGVRDLVTTLTDEYRGRYLYPCSDAAPQSERAGFLAPYGVELVPRVFYMNRAMPFRELPRTPFSRVLFTSSSTVKLYFENYADELKAGRTWVAVGPSTLKTLEELGLKAEMLSS
jgi:uroporphyrinogen-III synthase